ncbi:GmrSD restriction endonuclease domain-containing protein [Pseudomonas syringae group genomosp. 3]|uniref:GmrSD restriction endonuclease domain-containing protein n=1 Tax=Pseudomonas syringae group genomosp. 3 TaxID=251701 RepID=UPI0005CA19F7|nr:DUF262 domain-containing protein [Pseudomonas syringae group genomosp. 3]KPB97901.1 Uncharacterized protein AC506_2971 [Pseudomonas syringae pv. maculicola str. M6]KPX76961.1 Uncharacterized protein ALO84_00590 [Pseudomonas syringae pv. maculicola]
MSQDELILALESKVEKVHTQSLDLSFNELLDMFKDGELDINPDYQRLFRWSQGAQSRFIESLLLEMPVPPIYVVEDENGKYQLIDGLQRFSSYLHLRGELDAPHLSDPIEKGDNLKLQECDIVEDLNGLIFDDFPTALKIRLKRAFVRVEVVRKGSDNKFRYHMFKRLNTGGEALTSQQLRNCTIRMLDSKFIDFVIRLSKHEDFELCTGRISDQQKLGAFDQELVIRFFALKNYKHKFVHDVSDFLTEYTEKVTDPDNEEIVFDYAAEELIFAKTFSILSKCLGDKSFGRWGRQDVQSNFSVYHFEAICVGLQPYLERTDVSDENHIALIKAKLIEIKADAGFINHTTGGGKNSPGPLNSRIGIVIEKLAEVEI